MHHFGTAWAESRCQKRRPQSPFSLQNRPPPRCMLGRHLHLVIQRPYSSCSQGETFLSALCRVDRGKQSGPSGINP
ncbi:hypothetical protein NQZ68_017175 [Dissostichus eleginoides]|nr:hypothetical protein NQZ68_017175 [Dissostichus eleginoides]